MTTLEARTTVPSLAGTGFFLGLALGGFFDGILLHQVLQWHHLLSNVDAARDMRVQIMADGIFHALMYLIGATALWQLWRRRSGLTSAGTGRLLGGMALIGFGGWHILDAVLSHWVLGIHRIKVDAPQPLVWDLIWFFVFGVAPAVAGWMVLRRPGGGHGARVPGRHAAAALGLAVLVAGPIAALPGDQGDQVTVLFAPGVAPGRAFNALARLDARVLWVDRAGGTWAVSMDNPSAAWALYREGAMLVSRSGAAFGCLGWTRAPAAARAPDAAGSV